MGSVGYEFEPAPAWRELDLSELAGGRFTYLELRDRGPDGTIAFGHKCAEADDATSCAASFDALGSARRRGLDDDARVFLAVNAGNDNRGLAAHGELVAFFEPIDTPEEALVLARAAGHVWTDRCETRGAYRAAGDDFELIVSSDAADAAPPVSALLVSREGSIEVLERQPEMVLECDGFDGAELEAAPVMREEPAADPIHTRCAPPPSTTRPAASVGTSRTAWADAEGTTSSSTGLDEPAGSSSYRDALRGHAESISAPHRPGTAPSVEFCHQRYPLTTTEAECHDRDWFDLAPLGELKALKRLNLAGTGVSELGPLSALGSLRWLSLQGSPVHDVSALQGLRTLRTLDLRDTPVRDLRALRQLDRLEELLLSDTPVSDLRPLAQLENLRSLWLARTQVENLRPLSTLADLREIDLRGVPARDFRPLAKLSRLAHAELPHASDPLELTAGDQPLEATADESTHAPRHQPCRADTIDACWRHYLEACHQGDARSCYQAIHIADAGHGEPSAAATAESLLRRSCEIDPGRCECHLVLLQGEGLGQVAARKVARQVPALAGHVIHEVIPFVNADGVQRIALSYSSPERDESAADFYGVLAPRRDGFGLVWRARTWPLHETRYQGLIVLDVDGDGHFELLMERYNSGSGGSTHRTLVYAPRWGELFWQETAFWEPWDEPTFRLSDSLRRPWWAPIRLWFLTHIEGYNGGAMPPDGYGLRTRTCQEELADVWRTLD